MNPTTRTDHDEYYDGRPWAGPPLPSNALPASPRRPPPPPRSQHIQPFIASSFDLCCSRPSTSLTTTLSTQIMLTLRSPLPFHPVFSFLTPKNSPSL